jgi:hypothetical protein
VGSTPGSGGSSRECKGGHPRDLRPSALLVASPARTMKGPCDDNDRAAGRPGKDRRHAAPRGRDPAAPWAEEATPLAAPATSRPGDSRLQAASLNRRSPWRHAMEAGVQLGGRRPVRRVGPRERRGNTRRAERRPVRHRRVHPGNGHVARDFSLALPRSSPGHWTGLSTSSTCGSSACPPACSAAPSPARFTSSWRGSPAGALRP